MLDDTQIALLNELEGWDEFLAKAQSLTAPRKTVREWVSVAEQLASQNNGVLPSQGWLQKNGYGSLSQLLRKYPNAFAHIEQEKKAGKSIQEWIVIAQELAEEHGGKLPHHHWLIKNGYNGLALMLNRHPESFAHIQREIKRGRTADDWVKIAEELAASSDGVLPGTKWLNNNGYSGMTAAIKKHPEKFGHIEQEKKTRLDEWVVIANELVSQNEGVLPSGRWLKANGYGGLAVAMGKHTHLFAHIKQEREKRNADEWVIEAERLAAENKGILPMSGWLSKNGYSGLAAIMRQQPEKFAHIKQATCGRRTEDDWVTVAEELVAGNGGILQNSVWLQQNGYSGLASAIVKSPKKFRHIKQVKKSGKTADEWVEVAEGLARKRDGVLPNYSWLVENDYNGLAQAVAKYPDKFSHIEQEKKRTSSDEWVTIAEELAQKHHGVLPNYTWLQRNGYSGIIHAMKRHPAKFAHVQQDSKQGKSVDEWVALAEEIAAENGGMLPCVSELKRMNYVALVGAMYAHPDKFTHILMDSKQGKSVDEWVVIAEELAAKSGGVLPYARWLQQNGYVGLDQAIRKRPQMFAHIQQDKKRKTLEELVKQAEQLAAENGGVLPHYSWLRKNGYSFCESMLKHPERFAHIKQDRKDYLYGKVRDDCGRFKGAS